MSAAARRWTLAALAAAVVAIVLFPIYWMFVTSVLPSSLVLSRQPPLVPPVDAISFASYVEVFRRRPVFVWLANSAIVVAGSVAMSLVVSTLAGYSLSRFRTPAQRVAGATLLLSKMLPGSLVVIPFFFMYTTIGLIDSLAGLVLANVAVGVPFATWMMKGFFDTLPRELEQAAAIDGCTPMQTLWYVILPLARPGLAACGIYLAIVSWSEFVLARTLVTKPDHWVVTVGLQSFVGEYLVDWPALMAAGVVSLAPMLVLFLLLEPFLVSGLTSGAVKQ
ncbi:MAG: carbohydrate ABC transporter permease [Burkholderiales bacterium]|nr:carbohydrate ABC transporter permease [Burkholderiales bacterium]MCC7113430.1 carbohydrate ABC transporter permease [Burkholderiales bacterium]